MAENLSLEYMFDEIPDFGSRLQVAEGVFWIRMPLPMALDHINLWLLEDGDGWTLIDTGLHTRLSEKLWSKFMEESLDQRPINRIIVTHFHPDHVGMAGWLVERTKADFWMPRTEWLYARLLTSDDSQQFVDSTIEFYRRAGGDSEYLERLKEKGPMFPGMVSDVPLAIRRIVDNEIINIGSENWKIVVGNGHSPEHACLLSDSLGIFICGDLVLPRISPHIGVYADEQDNNPLDDYLNTLKNLHSIQNDVMVLPSHNEPYRGLHYRLDSLSLHHARRLDQFLSACEKPATAIDIARQVFKKRLDSSQLGLAAAETIAHLNHLMFNKKIKRENDKQGVYFYSA